MPNLKSAGAKGIVSPWRGNRPILCGLPLERDSSEAGVHLLKGRCRGRRGFLVADFSCVEEVPLVIVCGIGKQRGWALAFVTAQQMFALCSVGTHGPGPSSRMLSLHEDSARSDGGEEKGGKTRGLL